MTYRRPAVLALVAIQLVAVCRACCPTFNGFICGGHGDCQSEGCRCKCKHGFFGGDCSKRACPKGPAWTDHATAVDTAHALAECSNRGMCDTALGTCLCQTQFTGMACERMMCPLNCNGHGACRTMQYNARMKDPGAGQIYKYETRWDSKMMHGCHCDDGYFGHDCMLRECPLGDDPMTGTADDPNGVQVDEKQVMNCKATGGKFILYFRRQPTAYIRFDDSVEQVTAKLNALSTIKEVVVTFSGGRQTVCSESGGQSTIEFVQEHGDVPMLVPNTELLEHSSAIQTPSVAMVEELKGTKESSFCSDRGLCDVATGICTCVIGYDTSDGRGNQGNALHNRGDCGFAAQSIVACPGEVSCSGHGVCVEPPEASTYKCLCSNGWRGADCSERTCPIGHAWFDEPLADNRAHQKMECSNMGICDRTSGECTCADGFIGGACERMKCPGEPACTGHGQCLSMELLAEKAELNGDATEHTYGKLPNDPATWDFNKMYGCMCDEGFEGYDCSLRSCPHGDDPRTIHQTYEIQSLTCKATSGFFKIRFRQYITPPIRFDATEKEVTEAMIALKTVGLRKHESTDGLALGKGGWLGADRSVSIFSPITAFESGVLSTTFTKKWAVEGCEQFVARQACGQSASSLSCDATVPANLAGHCRCFGGVIGWEVGCTHTGGFTCETKCLEHMAKQRALGELKHTAEHPRSMSKERATKQVTYDKFCTADGSNTVLLTFLSELGDVPAVHVDVSDTYNNEGNGDPVKTHDGIKLGTGAPVITIETDGAGLSYRGTKENDECSNRGTCNYATGECTCFTGYGSSDGGGKKGNRRDCGLHIANVVPAS